MNKFAILISINAFLSFSALGDEWYVDKGNVDGPWDGTTWDTAFATVQEAIDAAEGGSEVIVAEGVYFENLQFNGKSLGLTSVNPLSPLVVANTILDGGGTDTVITLTGHEHGTSIRGFTIQNGSASNGGGISGLTTRITVERCVFRNNVATGGGCNTGNGAAIYSCRGLLQFNIIEHNTGNGAVVNLFHGTIQNNYICNNDGGVGSGGGIAWCTGSLIKNNLIAYNHGTYGGGIARCNDSIIMGNTIVGNTTPTSQGAIHWTDNTLLINNIIWGNTSPSVRVSSPPFFCCIDDWKGGGIGNISDDPQFADPGNGDFSLLSSSPCIDAGNINYLMSYDAERVMVDYMEMCRVAGSTVDLGAFEFGGLPDEDGDLLSDELEVMMGTDSLNRDSDADGLTDGVERLRGMNPAVHEFPPGIVVPEDIASLQEALFVAYPGEQITALPAVYTENIHFLGKDVVLTSTVNANAKAAGDTIIDGARRFAAVSFLGNESSNCVLRGFVVRNGRADTGGGIRGNHTRATIEYNRIVENRAGFGAGIAEVSGEIRFNVISDNRCSASYFPTGAGLMWCRGPIRNNFIVNNIIPEALHPAERPDLGYGEGGGISDCSGPIENNVIAYNRVEGDTGRAAAIGRNCGPVKNCIVWGNQNGLGSQLFSQPTYSCIENWQGGGLGNISSDPLFVDPSSGDFHIRADSPCIDAGALVGGLPIDLDGEPKGTDVRGEILGDGSDYDIGADEFVDADHDEAADIYDSDDDNDGLEDAQEEEIGTDPFLPDTDGDELTDGYEVSIGSNPLVIDTDGDTLLDGQETGFGTNPTLEDSDGDGLSDAFEVGYDGDSSDYDPYDPYTNPSGMDLNAMLEDTDGDTFPDSAELDAETDPLDASDHPVPGDINEDAEVNALDVQLAINAALSLPTGYDCDCNGDGSVDALDVQIVINAALGL